MVSAGVHSARNAVFVGQLLGLSKQDFQQFFALLAAQLAKRMPSEPLFEYRRENPEKVSAALIAALGRAKATLLQQFICRQDGAGAAQVADQTSLSEPKDPIVVKRAENASAASRAFAHEFLQYPGSFEASCDGTTFLGMDVLSRQC